MQPYIIVLRCFKCMINSVIGAYFKTILDSGKSKKSFVSRIKVGKSTRITKVRFSAVVILYQKKKT